MAITTRDFVLHRLAPRIFPGRELYYWNEVRGNWDRAGSFAGHFHTDGRGHTRVPCVAAKRLVQARGR